MATDGCLRDVRTGTGRPLQEMLKFIYPQKATKFCKIFTIDLSYVVTGPRSNSQIYGGDFAKFCVLLRIYERHNLVPIMLVFRNEDVNSDT